MYFDSMIQTDIVKSDIIPEFPESACFAPCPFTPPAQFPQGVTHLLFFPDILLLASQFSKRLFSFSKPPTLPAISSGTSLFLAAKEPPPPPEDGVLFASVFCPTRILITSSFFISKAPLM